ncbi:MAG: VOC family protein [Phenylobacterium sp.]|uniref:VOC family protein n=1 Tax=Phenylobacterium sp. TaxID=1871053 RepID=UPI0025D1111C|nr:VOC family protein [Phenylobacterium sp.]MBA4014025.1 VOC family protein [Phenylobacterium sp.]
MRMTGINHLALVCRDMAETVKFYTEVLGMPLYKTVALPDGGQHFFFDCGGGDSVAFFWWADAPPAAPGVASVKQFPEEPRSAIGSMNHVAFNVPEEKLDEYRQRLVDAGVKVLPNMVVNHDDCPMGVSAENHEGVFFRSVYFTDPNGIMLELAATTRSFGPDDVRHAPASAALAEA